MRVSLLYLEVLLLACRVGLGKSTDRRSGWVGKCL